ncbi:MAG: hypothetical protein FJ207_04765 [Gemmatimonadetes bacterium]|nr:hypothetical protein [Gemmatimonadota bacterium]
MISLRALGPVAVVIVVTATGCTDQGPVSAPGTLTATLVSPNGAEGAAVVALTGEGIGPASGVGDVTLFRSDDPDGTTLVLVSPGGGTLAFAMALAYTTRVPASAVEQVAGTDDEMRTSVATYRVVWSR